MKIKLTDVELSLLAYTLQVSGGAARQYALGEMYLALALYEQVKARIVEKKDEKGEMTKVYSEGDIEFSMDDKVMVSKFINEDKWGMGDAPTVKMLLEKLK